MPQLTPNGRWSDTWRSKGAPSSKVRLKAHVVGRNADGRQEIFALGDDNALWQKWQMAPNNGWSDWKSLGTPASRYCPDRPVHRAGEIRMAGRRSSPPAATATSGRSGKPRRTAAGAIGRDWDNRCRNPAFRSPDRGKKQRRPPGVIRHGWRRCSLARMAAGAKLGWSMWESLRKPRDPSSSGTQGPRHFRTAGAGECRWAPRSLRARQRSVLQPMAGGAEQLRLAAQGWNAKPKPRPASDSPGSRQPLNFENRIEALGLGDDGALWHAWQIDVAPNWSEWNTLAAPAAKIRAADRLTIGTTQDGQARRFRRRPGRRSLAHCADTCN